MAIRMLAGLLFVAGLVSAAQQAQPKPLSKEQVVALVRNGLGDDSGAKMVKERGLDFAPARDFVESLRIVGAHEVFIQAVQEATHPGGELHAKKALNRVQVKALVNAGIASSRVATLLSERGIDFEPTDDFLQQLRTDGAGQDVVDALKTAERVKPPEEALAHPPQPDSEMGTPQAPGGDTKAHRIQVGGQVQSARLIYKESPVYPPLAKAARIQGLVRMEAIIGKDGTVQDIKVISGQPFLIESALEAVSRWRYQPTLLSGEPVEVATEIDINFTLGK